MGPVKHIILASVIAAFAAAQATNPNECPYYDYIGCFTNAVNGDGDDITDLAASPMTMDSCLDACYYAGGYYAGVQDGTTCYCASDLIEPSSEVDQSQCNIACEGDTSELCGGASAQSVYTLTANGSNCPAGPYVNGVPPGSANGGSTPADGGSTPADGGNDPAPAAPGPSTAPYPTTTTTNTSTAVYGATGGSGPILTTGGSGTNTGASPVSTDSVSDGNESNTAASSRTDTGTGTGTAASTTRPTVAPPGPTVSGTSKACYQYTLVDTAGETCYNVQQTYDVDFNTLQGLNPSLNADCTNLLQGYAYCVAGIAARLAGGLPVSSPTTGTPSIGAPSSGAPGYITSEPVSTVSTIPPGYTGPTSSYTSAGSVCQFVTYTMNMGGVTVGTMSS